VRGDFCNEDGGREGSKSVDWMRSIKEVELASHYAEPSELAYLDGIPVASAIVVTAEGEVNCRLRTGDDLPGGREVVRRRNQTFLPPPRDRPCNRTRETARLQGGLEIDGHASSPAYSLEKG
jgi:hypothetical protein